MKTISELVGDLTLPSFEYVFQRVEETGESRTSTVELPPLLLQLRDRVWPSGQSDGRGSKSMPSTRSLVDDTALYDYARIAAQIGDWCRMARLVATRDAIADLRAWHDHTKAVLAGDTEVFYRKQLAGWVGLIRDHLQPPERVTIEHPCPACGTTGWGDQITGGDRWPIELRYWVDESQHPHGEVARCRVCGLVWRGRAAVEELGEELNEKRLLEGSTK
ncbi:MAG TPA: hypothetical protein VFU07_07230 [Candidatus Lumbricidophila sp.]|nr:hypothetical protein [Candidatus Lumbricidophila sp.]